ncbi:replication protein A, subunit RPA32 [Amniculicola lignicola CBS 123094]|uniref:Replication protein A, subunit RPA32 n=1 Tax=Amniculicola lignicola CBS 123094 TaxID=1392246 RepID=A0A6A5W7Z2_9PLEO|nr:replication protein A, subunit RPA32 [Amniculicola lignicola CBS 123094]
MSYSNNYETSYTSYGAGGGASSGGFIPGEGSQNSPSGRKDYTQDTLRAVTIKQMLDSPQSADEIFKIDNTPISQVTFVAQIRNISSQTTNITYKVDDGTGSMEVKLWVDSDNENAQDANKAKLVENTYCRVWGKLKSFQNKKHVGATVIRPVEDMNEISYHLLEATVVHLYFTRGPPGGQADTAAHGGQVPQITGGEYSGGQMVGYSKVAQKVFEYMRQAPQSNEGLHQHDIAANIGCEITDVAKAGDDLLAGGLIYTTVDDQTWAVLEAD